MRTAILAASFGTSSLPALDRSILAVENAIAAAFSDVPVYRAFTSAVVRRTLLTRHGMHVPGISEALERMQADGVTHAVVQPTLLFRGGEYERLCREVCEHAGSMHVEIGLPLIETAAELEDVLSAMQAACPAEDGVHFVAAAHGSHEPGGSFARLAGQVCSPAVLCGIEGEPSFAQAIKTLSARPGRRVHIAALLQTFGAHAGREIIGAFPTSLRSLLEAVGFEVSWSETGLGELPAIQAMYVRRTRNALAFLKNDA